MKLRCRQHAHPSGFLAPHLTTHPDHHASRCKPIPADTTGEKITAIMLYASQRPATPAHCRSGSSEGGTSHAPGATVTRPASLGSSHGDGNAGSGGVRPNPVTACLG